jgi:SAM-dependent methyltransferase
LIRLTRQLAFARTRPAARLAQFRSGDAMALPFPDDRFDGAIMTLVIFFVPEPAKGVAEMARVVAPGGTVATYAWDMAGGGYPGEPIHAALRALGQQPLLPPSVDASRIEALQTLWTGAGLDAVQTRDITLSRTFADFDDFWVTNVMSANLRPIVAAMSSGDAERLKAGVRQRVRADEAGHITVAGRANAVKGRVPQ